MYYLPGSIIMLSPVLDTRPPQILERDIMTSFGHDNNNNNITTNNIAYVPQQHKFKAAARFSESDGGPKCVPNAHIHAICISKARAHTSAFSPWPPLLSVKVSAVLSLYESANGVYKYALFDLFIQPVCTRNKIMIHVR